MTKNTSFTRFLSVLGDQVPVKPIVAIGSARELHFCIVRGGQEPETENAMDVLLLACLTSGMLFVGVIAGKSPSEEPTPIRPRLRKCRDSNSTRRLNNPQEA